LTAAVAQEKSNPSGQYGECESSLRTKKEFFDIVEAMVFPSHTADSEGAEIIAA